MKNNIKIKLVRDKIPEIIKNNNENPDFYIADKKEYWERLKDKLREEVEEVLEEDNIQEELADVLEVVYSIAKFQNIDFEEVEKSRLEKKEKRGGFEERIVLKGVK